MVVVPQRKRDVLAETPRYTHAHTFDRITTNMINDLSAVSIQRRAVISW